MFLVKSSINVTFIYIKVSIFLAKNFLNGFFHRASLKLAVLAVEQNGNLEKKVKRHIRTKQDQNVLYIFTGLTCSAFMKNVSHLHDHQITDFDSSK